MKIKSNRGRKAILVVVALIVLAALLALLWLQLAKVFDYTKKEGYMQLRFGAPHVAPDTTVTKSDTGDYATPQSVVLYRGKQQTLLEAQADIRAALEICNLLKDRLFIKQSTMLCERHDLSLTDEEWCRMMESSTVIALRYEARQGYAEQETYYDAIMVALTQAGDVCTIKCINGQYYPGYCYSTICSADEMQSMQGFLDRAFDTAAENCPPSRIDVAIVALAAVALLGCCALLFLCVGLKKAGKSEGEKLSAGRRRGYHILLTCVGLLLVLAVFLDAFFITVRWRYGCFEEAAPVAKSAGDHIGLEHDAIKTLEMRFGAPHEPSNRDAKIIEKLHFNIPRATGIAVYHQGKVADFTDEERCSQIEKQITEYFNDGYDWESCEAALTDEQIANAVFHATCIELRFDQRWQYVYGGEPPEYDFTGLVDEMAAKLFSGITYDALLILVEPTGGIHLIPQIDGAYQLQSYGKIVAYTQGTSLQERMAFFDDLMG